MTEIEFKLKGYDLKKNEATKQGKGAHVYVPKDWIGKKVAVVLLEDLEETS